VAAYWKVYINFLWDFTVSIMPVIELTLRGVFRWDLCRLQVKISWLGSQCIEEQVVWARTMFFLLATCLVILIHVLVPKKNKFSVS